MPKQIVEYNYKVVYIDAEGNEVKKFTKTIQAGSDFSAKGMARAEAMWLHGFHKKRGGKITVTRRARKNMPSFRFEVGVPEKD